MDGVDWGLERVFTFLFIIIFLLFFKYLTFRYFRKLSEQNQTNWNSSNNPEICHVHTSRSQSNTHHPVDLSAPPPQFESALKYPTLQNIAYIEIDPPSYEEIVKSSRINLSQSNGNEIDTSTSIISKTPVTQNSTSIPVEIETINQENPQENKPT